MAPPKSNQKNVKSANDTTQQAQFNPSFNNAATAVVLSKTHMSKACHLGMLKFSETDQEPKFLDERELRKIAQEEARAEEARAYEVPGQSGDGIYALCMAQFEEWLKIQKQHKREYEAAGKGEYVLRSTVAPQEFMTQVKSIPGLGALTISTQGQQQQIVHARKRQDKKAGEGCPDLDFKNLRNPNAKKAKKNQSRFPTIMQGASGDDMGRRGKRNLAY
ncbi:hypothetical protein E8E11_007496 [Didymella keratinophila]|nr:hypothetical protein E8E11_007496 [Didymella keratinophila]